MSTEAETDILSFLPWHGYEVAFIGLHPAGAIRDLAPGGAEWTFLFETNASATMPRWHAARDVGHARAALMRRAADWYDAAHTRLAPGQGERLAAQVRIS